MTYGLKTGKSILTHTRNTDTHMGIVDQDIAMGTHKLTDLSNPINVGDSLRKTAIITEAALESAIAYIGGSFTPLTGGYLHIQTAASETWNVAHNIGTKFVNVEVINSNDKGILPAGKEFVDENNLILTFSPAVAGKAVVSVGGRVGLTGTGFGGSVDGGEADTQHWDIEFNLGSANTTEWAFSSDCGGAIL